MEGHALLGAQGTLLVNTDGSTSASHVPRPLLNDDFEPRTLSDEEPLTEGRLKEALELYQSLTKEARVNQDEKHLAQAILGLARAHRDLGDHYRALVLGSEALDLCRGLRDPVCRALAHHHQAHTWRLLGERRRARIGFQRALELWPEISIGRWRTLRSLAALHDQIGDHEIAIELLRRALLLVHLAPQSDTIARRKRIGITLDQLAQTYQSAGRLEDARVRYERALAIWLQDGQESKSAATHARLGWLLLEQQKPLEARSRFSQALEHLRQTGAPKDLAQALLGAAHADRRTGDLSAATQQLMEAIDLLDSQPTKPFGQAPSDSILIQRQPYFELLIEIFMQQHEAEPRLGFDRQALELAERFRSRGLLELLQAESWRSSEASSPGLARQLGKLRKRIANLQRERLELLREEASIKDLAELEERRRKAIQRVEHLEAGLHTDDSKPAPPASITFGEMQNLLDEETTLLAYFLGSERSFLWQLTRKQLLAHELPSRERIDNLARGAYAFLANSDQRRLKSEGEQTLQDLSAAVLAPIPPASLPRRIVLMADGFLHYIPFASLTLPGGRPIVEHFEVTSVPSFSVLRALRERAAQRQPAPKLLGVMADPVFQPADERSNFSKPTSADAPLPAAPGRLERAGQEGRKILSLVPPSQSFGAFGFQATREAILGGALSPYRLVHLATHGELNDAEPDYTHLVFSLLDPRGKPLEGRLYQHEIDELDLAADLVTLSACNSALGRYVRGEGLLGMTRAFMDAGATRVLVSLWFVSEAATAELMERFYRELLLCGKGPAEALRSAQAWMRRHSSWTAPFYWAGFVLQGDWIPLDQLPASTSSTSPTFPCLSESSSAPLPTQESTAPMIH